MAGFRFWGLGFRAAGLGLGGCRSNQQSGL